VLENPKVILLRQEDKAKGTAIARMKQEGMEYEERMAELEKITWPKPLEEFLYSTFNDFKKTHPWVEGQNVRPKSIARDLLERYMTFNEYVKEYGLERSEGLLLRSLSDFYKTFSQTIPEPNKTDALWEIEAHFRALIARVDASLVEEWESLANPQAREKADPSCRTPVVVVELDANPRTFALRVRADLHLFVKELAVGDFDDAATHVSGIDAAALKAAAAAFADDKGHGIRFDLDARRNERTVLEKDGERRYRVRQVLTDEHGDDDWVIEGEIDLAARTSADDPLITIVRIGR
jgi:hypothetical protein